MKSYMKWSWVLLLLSYFGISQAALLDEARVVSATKSLASMLPAPGSFTINTAGTYTLTLSDLQGQNGPGSPFSSLTAVISQGSLPIKTLTLPTNTFTTNSSVTLAAGQYQVQVLGVTSVVSQYGVNLRNGSNVSVWSDSAVITAPVINNYATLQQVLTVTSGHNYTLTLSDRIFPTALTNLQASIVQNGNVVVCPITAVATTTACNFTASGTDYQLFVVAAEASSGAGLYSVKLFDHTTGNTVYADTLPLGTMPEPTSITLPATDSYALTSIDFFNPAPLSAFKLALVQGGDLLVKQTTTGGAVAFNATAGAASLYVIPQAASGTAAQYSVSVKRGSTSVFTLVDSVADVSDTGTEGFVFKVNLPAPGNYALQLRDFAYPTSFTSLNVSTSQNGALIGTPLVAPGTLTITNAAAGELVIAVVAKPAGGGLFGLTLTANGSSTPILEKTQGVGASFTSAAMTVPANGRYAVKATDFFSAPSPLALNQLRVAVTRGTQLIGQIFGGGSFEFDATAGIYTLNFIATSKATPGYGMFGASFGSLPTVTLTASASSVASGTSTTLNWTSTDATACTASGGWSGTQPVNGSVSVGPLTSTTTFNLSCAGITGSATQSITVNIQPSATVSKKGGGGASSLEFLLALLGVAGARRLRAAR